MSAGKVISLIVGSIVLLAGMVMLIAGGTLVGVNLAFTDDEGFLTLPSAGIEKNTYAVTGEATLEGEWIWWWRNPATVHVSMEGEKPVFIGIARRSDVEEYLSDVSYARIEEIDFSDYRTDRVWATEYLERIGPSAPKQPSDQTFWRASIQGEGEQRLTWTIEPGEWTLVLMNADASRGIDLVGTVGAKAPWTLGLGIGLLGIGFALFAIGLIVVLFVASRSRTGRGPEQAAEEQPTEAGFPLSFKGEMSEPLSPVLWLVKWFLLIPHFIVLCFLWFAFCVSWLMSAVAILFTARYPRSLFDFNVGVMRWTWRVGFYSYQALGTDRYPPFTLEAGGYPADLAVQYPRTLSRGLVLVKWWLLAIPHYIIVGILQGGGGFYSSGLVVILTVFAGVALLFTGRYPRDIFRLVVSINRWTYRVFTYAALMTDRYPPFRLDE